MINYLASILLLGFFSAYLRAEPICIQSFNMYGPAYAQILEWRTKKFFEQLDPCSIIHLQEVWQQNHIRQIEKELEAFPQYKTTFPDKIRNDGWSTGLLQIHRAELIQGQAELFKINFSGVLDWFRDNLSIGKSWSTSRYQLKFPWNTVSFSNTHLHPQSQSIRLTQLLQWLQLYGLEDEVIVLSGDFNFEPGSIEYKLITQVYQFKDILAESSECTYCVDNPLGWGMPSRRIDYIFIRNSSKWELSPFDTKIVFREIEGLPLSDHYGVQTYLELKPSLLAKHPIENRAPAEAKEVLSEVLRILKNESSADFNPFADFAEEILKNI